MFGRGRAAPFRLNGLYHDADMPGRDVVTNERWAVAPSFSLGLGTSTRATFLYQHMAQDNVPDYGIPWVPANTNPLLRDYSDKAPPVDFDNFYGLQDYDTVIDKSYLYLVVVIHLIIALATLIFSIETPMNGTSVLR